MRQTRLWIFAALLAGIMLVLAASIVAAQGGDTPPAYMGADECAACHRGLAGDHAETLHSQALLAPDAENAIVADFDQGADVRGADIRAVVLPGESEARPFTADDIAYVIGAGRYAQRYAVTGEDGTLWVLPAEWNAIDGRWQPFTLAESWPDPAYDFGANCAYCHTTGLDPETETWVDDGVQCEACHGPAETHVTLADDLSRNASDEEVDAVRAAIYNQPDSQMCGQCHTRGTDAATERPYPTTYRPGDDLLAGFTPAPATDTTHWWATGHAAQPNMQFNEWLNSAHANSLAAVQNADNADDSCLTCHSGDYRYVEKIRGWFDEFDLDGTLPASLTVQTATQGVTCQTCHNPHSEEDYSFYLVNDTYDLCAECHTTANYTGEGVHHPNVEIYEGQPLVEEVPGIPSGHFSTEGGPNCQTCHMPALPVSDGGAEEGSRFSHALLPVPLDAPHELADVAACTACHNNVPPTEVQAMVTDVQANVSARLESAQAALIADSPDWVRTALAAVAGDGSRGLHNYGYANALLGAAENAIAAAAAPPEPPPAEATAAAEEAALEETENVSPLFEPIILPVVGRVEGLTVVGSTLGGLAFLASLFGGIALILLRRGWWRWLGGGLLIVAIVLLVIALLLIFPAKQYVAASGEDSYCQVCHTTDAHPLMMADGNILQMSVDPAGITGSVHGADSPTGRMGCLDCHGTEAFPHSNVPPQDLRLYRVDMSTVCASCHEDVLAHYEEVRDRDILVGCADCHGAHDVRPANALEILPEHVIEQILQQRGLPTPTPVNTPSLATPIAAGTRMPITPAVSGPVSYQVLQPHFVAFCGSCHGTDSPRAGLTLTTYEGIMAGGRSGPVVAPGDPDNSVIIQVQSEPHDANFPPPDMQLLLSWIRAGAPEYSTSLGLPTAVPAATATPQATPEASAEATEETPAAASAGEAISGPDYQTLQPILEASCGECHGEESPRAGLTLTTYAGIIAGDRGGLVVEPGDPANSYILEAQAEPHDANLTPEELQLLTDWIAAGAPETASGAPATEAEAATEAPATEVPPTEVLATEAPAGTPEATPLPASIAEETADAQSAEPPSPSGEISGPLDYQTLQPVLQARCGECHGEDSPRAGLTLTTYAGIIAGDRGGTVVEPGDPANSFILEVMGEAHDANLSPEELQFLTDWIAAGAPETAN